MTSTPLVRIVLALLISAACACSKGGSSPTGPSSTSTTATVTGCTDLSNCSTNNVKGIFITISAGAAFTYTFAGNTITGSSNLTRQFVGITPGEYDIVGQAGGGVGLGFSPSRGFGATALQVIEGSVSSRSCANVNFGAVGNPGSPPESFKIRIRLGDSDTQTCLSSSPVTPTPPTATGPGLSGTWAGTNTATIGNNAPRTPDNLTFVFQHSGNGLTATLTSNRATFQASLDLTAGQVSGASSTFTGNLTMVDTGRTTVMPGSMTVNTGDNTMTGTFSGTNTDGLPERNVFALRKQ